MALSSSFWGDWGGGRRSPSRGMANKTLQRRRARAIGVTERGSGAFQEARPGLKPHTDPPRRHSSRNTLEQLLRFDRLRSARFLS